MRDAYISLCVRRATLSAAEIKAIRAEDVALIMEVRERAFLQEGVVDRDTESVVSTLVDTLSKLPSCFLGRWARRN